MVDAPDEDDVPHSPDSNNNTSTPVPVILARNIQKFFAGKLSSKTAHHDMDVTAVLEDIDLILAGRSLEDGRILLQGMVADLLREIDLLKFRLGETSQSLQRVKEERDVVNHDYRDRLLALTLALSQHSNRDGSHDDIVGDVQQRCQGGAILTADEATTVTIQALTKKIESLEVKVGSQQEQLAHRREQIEDLESDNAAKALKIAALERQFKTLNIHRVNTGEEDSDGSVISEPPRPSYPSANIVSPSSVAASGRVSKPKLVKLVDSEL